MSWTDIKSILTPGSNYEVLGDSVGEVDWCKIDNRIYGDAAYPYSNIVNMQTTIGDPNYAGVKLWGPDVTIPNSTNVFNVTARWDKTTTNLLTSSPTVPTPFDGSQAIAQPSFTNNLEFLPEVTKIPDSYPEVLDQRVDDEINNPGSVLSFFDPAGMSNSAIRSNNWFIKNKLYNNYSRQWNDLWQNMIDAANSAWNTDKSRWTKLQDAKSYVMSASTIPGGLFGNDDQKDLACAVVLWYMQNANWGDMSYYVVYRRDSCTHSSYRFHVKMWLPNDNNAYQVWVSCYRFLIEHCNAIGITGPGFEKSSAYVKSIVNPVFSTTFHVSGGGTNNRNPLVNLDTAGPYMYTYFPAFLNAVDWDSKWRWVELKFDISSNNSWMSNYPGNSLIARAANEINNRGWASGIVKTWQTYRQQYVEVQANNDQLLDEITNQINVYNSNSNPYSPILMCLYRYYDMVEESQHQAAEAEYSDITPQQVATCCMKEFDQFTNCIISVEQSRNGLLEYYQLTKLRKTVSKQMELIARAELALYTIMIAYSTFLKENTTPSTAVENNATGFRIKARYAVELITELYTIAKNFDDVITNDKMVLAYSNSYVNLQAAVDWYKKLPTIRSILDVSDDYSFNNVNGPGRWWTNTKLANL